jgi:hypothetical protein
MPLLEKIRGTLATFFNIVNIATLMYFKLKSKEKC